MSFATSLSPDLLRRAPGSETLEPFAMQPWPPRQRAPASTAEDLFLAGHPAAGPLLEPLATLRKPSEAGAVLGTEEAEALEERRREADHARAQEIRAAMQIDRRLSEVRIAALWADLQTEVFRIWEEVLVRRQKIMNELLEKWCKVMME